MLVNQYPFICCLHSNLYFQTMRKDKPQSSSFNIPDILTTDSSVAILLALFAFIIYANTLGHGFVLDDDLVCRLNPSVQQGLSGISDIFSSSWYEAFSGEKDRYYRPMMVASFAIEHQWFGFNPFVFHLNNVLLFGICIFLMYYLLRKLIPTQHKSIIIVACLLYAAHPIHTEVVANIKGRDELFAFLGLLGMLLSSMHYNKTKNKAYLLLSLCSFLFALLSKESSIAFLGLIPITQYFFTSDRLKDIVIRTIPYAILAFSYLFLRAQIINTSPPPFDLIDNTLLSASTLLERVATTFYMLGLYIKLLFVPNPLCYDYSFNQIPIVSFTNLRVLISVFLVSFLIIYSLLKLKTKDIFSFSILWIICTFIITSNIFFLIGTTFAERLMFIPSLGFCVGITFLLNVLAKRYNQKRHQLFLGVSAPIIIIFALLTINRNQDWKSNEVLFSTDIINASQNSRAQSHYAKILYDKSQQSGSVDAKQLLNKAISSYQESIVIYPGNPQTYQNLGLAFTKLGDEKNALEAYTNGLKVKSDYSPLYINRAHVFYNSGRYKMAIDDLIKAEQITPDHKEMTMVFGLTYTKLKDYNKALPYLLSAYENNPKDRNTLVCLVEVYRNMDKIDTAIFYDKKIWALDNNK